MLILVIAMSIPIMHLKLLIMVSQISILAIC